LAVKSDIGILLWRWCWSFDSLSGNYFFGCFDSRRHFSDRCFFNSRRFGWCSLGDGCFFGGSWRCGCGGNVLLDASLAGGSGFGCGG
jgi:hypothetical protein